MAEPDVKRGGWTIPRLLAIGTALALILFWIWIFSGAPKKQNPDRLTDRAWVTRAEATCAAAMQRIDALPPAQATKAAEARAAVVGQANDELTTMLDKLTADRADDAGDRELVGKWLVDWRRYVANREDYARRLRTDPNARLFVDEKFNDSIETVVSTFAQVNDMDSCATPTDVS
jgi:hypothetical protein